MALLWYFNSTIGNDSDPSGLLSADITPFAIWWELLAETQWPYSWLTDEQQVTLWQIHMLWSTWLHQMLWSHTWSPWSQQHADSELCKTGLWGSHPPHIVAHTWLASLSKAATSELDVAIDLLAAPWLSTASARWSCNTVAVARASPAKLLGMGKGRGNWCRNQIHT